MSELTDTLAKLVYEDQQAYGRLLTLARGAEALIRNQLPESTIGQKIAAGLRKELLEYRERMEQRSQAYRGHNPVNQHTGD